VTGLVAGLAGGAIALALHPSAPAPTATATPPIVIPTPPPSDAARMQAAIQRVLPAVVTVVADLPPQQVQGGELQRENLGSGIVIDGAGHVITNFHVIDGAQTVTVVLSTGERRPARVIDDDSPFNDVAVLQVPPAGLRAAAIGDADQLQLGQPVAAVVSGLVSFDNQAKVGVVSATHVDFPRPGITMLDLIQTDAAVNHGDSGGALINADGEVVGLITTVVRSTPDGQIVEGVALAQSINDLTPPIQAIIANGYDPRPRWGIERLGSEHLAIDSTVAQQRGLPVDTGALIIGVAPGSPAAQAGVQNGDIVVGLNGSPIDGDHPLVNELQSLPGDGRAVLLILRGSQRLSISVTPASPAGPHG
jgi:S1-C subfamily serine protease